MRQLLLSLLMWAGMFPPIALADVLLSSKAGLLKGIDRITYAATWWPVFGDTSCEVQESKLRSIVADKAQSTQTLRFLSYQDMMKAQAAIVRQLDEVRPQHIELSLKERKSEAEKQQLAVLNAKYEPLDAELSRLSHSPLLHISVASFRQDGVCIGQLSVKMSASATNTRLKMNDFPLMYHHIDIWSDTTWLRNGAGGFAKAVEDSLNGVLDSIVEKWKTDNASKGEAGRGK